MDISEEKKNEYFKTVNENIKTKGFHTTAVLEDVDFTPFAYSTGIFENFEIPELIISGLGPNFSGELIENYVEKYKFNKVPINTKIENLTDRFPIFFIEVENENLVENVLSSIKFYENREYKYLQLIFPDLNLYFPTNPNYDYDQKIFGEFKI
ncbi:protein of unknown function [Soonwooa buanensis]|uniref:DUF4262 domain-containing protein n=1 Tax=Soonwooa buanensis TaxID=619805 RepID=A0A1T5G7N3_9FLAO|nr:DUF4262 domain-containing protein [Soonwooa buanensis]SKC04397.1 protein of unknown function [Soonwooa buanensis]